MRGKTFLLLTFLSLLIASQFSGKIVTANMQTSGKNIHEAQSGRELDVFTQKGGIGNYTPSGSFGPAELVFLYANVTYNGWPIQNEIVAFEALAPHGDLFTILSGLTNASGIATASYRLPFSKNDPLEWFGNWTIIASADVADVVVYDTLKFEYTLHDIAIENMKLNKNIVGAACSLRVELNVSNLGYYLETFNLTIYANFTSVTTSSVTLNCLSSTSTTVSWITTDLAKGNYTVGAYAHPVPKETTTIDNLFTNGWVFITILGDINGDKFVNAEDAVALGVAFYSFGDYNPNADINDDGYCNAKDAVLLGMHFNEHWE
ncbi:hypothetical protein HXY33_02030 [Candidatus Bathyarchaeota archaeon]|nr:hypothetical protein [Candidatus Bathyarchaeota archaeon]